MPDRLSVHAPLLINTIGHSAGAIIFGILLYLLVLDWRRGADGKSVLPSVAAALGFLWNLGSLVGLATAPQGDQVADAIIAASFSVLSFLPAVLLHISSEHRTSVYATGYVLSSIATVLHFADLLTGSARFHNAALLFITFGFAALTTILIVMEAYSGKRDGTIRRLAGSMVLFLFAISFVHFGSGHTGTSDAGRAWSGEIALHHAGIPLALFVLLQDYRFLLLDTFIRFLVNAGLAAAAVTAAVLFSIRFDPIGRVYNDPFRAALAFVGACLLLLLFGFLRREAQQLVTRTVFLRSNPDHAAAAIRGLAVSRHTGGSQAGETRADEIHINELQYLAAASREMAAFIGASRHECVRADAWDASAFAWVQAVIPISLARGDGYRLMLGARRGGRRYLSEDIAALEKLAGALAQQVERMRSSEMQGLVSEAELRALQAQINPHFFFNALNTLYGSISRDNAVARRLILNLSDLFRHSLRSDRASIRIDDELKLVRAYLEIEELRLGPRLRTEIVVEDAAQQVEIPAFSIQPLVENAVKHGAAAQTGTAWVRLSIRLLNEHVRIEISNSGPFRPKGNSRGAGVGLANVQRRLALRYGASAGFEIESGPESTRIYFSIPLPRPVATIPA